MIEVIDSIRSSRGLVMNGSPVIHITVVIGVENLPFAEVLPIITRKIIFTRSGLSLLMNM